MKKIKSKAYSYFSNKASERMLIHIFNILNNDLMRNLLLSSIIEIGKEKFAINSNEHRWL